MTTQTTSTRQYYGALATYTIQADTKHRWESSKWNRLLNNRKLACGPFDISEETSYLYVLHDSESELTATRLSVPDLMPEHEARPSQQPAADFYGRHVLTYPRRDLLAAPLNPEVEDRLCAMIFFKASQADLPKALAALKVRRYGIAHRVTWGTMAWSLDRGAVQ